MTELKGGPSIPISQEIHATKYRSPGETYREYAIRVSSTLADSKEHFFRSRELLENMKFLPPGRVQSAVGSTRMVTAHNCFVSGTIQDNFTDPDGIMVRATEAARTMRMGGGIGYDFSSIRPRNELITTLDSLSSGPVSFMGIYNAVGVATSSAGHRRGAQMAVLRVDHPDIEEFIRAKHNTTELTGFNVSIAVTDEFMEAVRRNGMFDLRWNGRVYKKVHARTLWDIIMRSTWDWAEPGVLFIDRINDMNNLHYCETIAATNPCGEQPLPPYGACLLGSMNLTRFLQRSAGKWEFNWDSFKWAIPPVVRMMDNVIDKSHYPLPQQRDEARAKRRMGLGVTGLANTVEALGFPYGSDGSVEWTETMLKIYNQYAYETSTGLAQEKGAFPLFKKEEYLDGKYIQGLPAQTRDMIAEYGIRNSHLTSIAPTGTISLAADNVSSGIEPVFAEQFERKYNSPDGMRTEVVMDYGLKFLGVKPKVAAECSAEDHLAILLACSKHVDSAVSKTCNVSPNMDWDAFKDIYMQAYLGGAKGCTTYNTGGQRGSILTEVPVTDDTAVDDEPQFAFIDGATCERDPLTGRTNCE